MFKLKGNIEPTTLIEYEFEEWQPNSNVWKYCERGHYVWKIRIDKDGYLRFNCPTNATIKKFYDLVKADIVDYVPEKPKKAYAYMTKLELEKEIENLKEIVNTKDKIIESFEKGEMIPAKKFGEGV